MLTYSQLVDAVLNKNQEVIDLMQDKVELLNVIKVLGDAIEKQQSVIEEQNGNLKYQDNVIYNLSLKNTVLTGHVETLKMLKELEMNEYTEESDIPLILGTLDGFFECIEQDLKDIDN